MKSKAQPSIRTNPDKRGVVRIAEEAFKQLADLAVNDHRTPSQEVAHLVALEWERRHPKPPTPAQSIDGKPSEDAKAAEHAVTGN